MKLFICTLSLLCSLSLNSSLVNAAESFPPCGLSGSLEERIQDCSKVYSSYAHKVIKISDTDGNGKEKIRFAHWKLVTVNEGGQAFWRDSDTGLTWSDITTDLNHEEAGTYCEGLSDAMSPLSFSLPSMAQFRAAEKNASQKILPHMDYWQWTSDLVDEDQAKGYMGTTGVVVMEKKTEKRAVRCVGNAITP